MFLYRLIQKFKVIKRLNYIFLVFFQAGFGALMANVGFSKHVHPFRKIGRETALKSELPSKLKKALERLGPVFVKFGQILSTRSDLLPKEYTSELEKLQSQVEPFSYREAEKILNKAFPKGLKENFSQFEKQPFASASLGQVYKAELKSGQKVAVKIQRPGAKKKIQLDTEVLLMLAHMLEKHVPEIRKYNLTDIVLEFKRWTLNELDYRKEAANCEIFSKFFEEDENIYGPKVFWELSSESVLTLEFVEGVSLKAVYEDKADFKVNKKLLAHHIADSFIKQFFEYGFFHADPHPGNIFVLKDGKILFLDFGMVGFLDDQLTSLCAAMFLSLVQKDVENLVTLLSKLEQHYDDRQGKTEPGAGANINGLRKQLNVLVLQWSAVGQAGQFTRLFQNLLTAAVENGINIPTDLSMLAKSIATLDIVMQQLDPDFNIVEWEQPMVEKIISRKLSAKHLGTRAKNAGIILEDLLKKLPDSTATIVENIEKGRFGMEVNAQQLAQYERLLNANSKINTYGTLLAATAIASALIYKIPGQPEFWGFSVAQLGFYGSLILILMYFITNTKKGI